MCDIYVDHENMAHTGVQYDLPAGHAISIGTMYNHKNSIPNNLNGLIVHEQSWKPTDFGADKRYYCKISNRLKTIFRNNIDFLFSKLYEIKTSRETIKRSIQHGHWTKLETIKNVSKILGLDESFVDKNVLYVKTKNSFPINNKEIKISPELARITGHILCDGGIHVVKDEGKYRIFYVNNEHALLNSFRKDINIIFGKVKIYSRNRDYQGDELWLPTTTGLILNKIIDIGTSIDKKIPEFIIKNQNYDIIRNFLQAVFDDEGYLYPEKYMICISLINLQLLSGIKYLVEKIGIKTNPIHIHKSKNRSTMFYFSITGEENILKFSSKVNFTHSIKSRKLHRLVNKYGD